jgi:hypothetical protein
MSRVIALVEGQTEQNFVQDLLAPYLGVKGVYITARLIGKPGHKGGVGEYERTRRDILILLKQENDTIITTMFDFYGMPDSWPGRSSAKDASFSQKAIIVERGIRDDITMEFGGSFDERRFLPYIQMHEFEALLFADPPAIAKVLRSPNAESSVQDIRNAFTSPEEINDNITSAPSKRLLTLFSDYRKRLHGPIIAVRIGIEKMRTECPHFAEWLAKLELLG